MFYVTNKTGAKLNEIKFCEASVVECILLSKVTFFGQFCIDWIKVHNLMVRNVNNIVIGSN